MRWFNNLSVSKKLIGSFSIASLIVVAVAVIGILVNANAKATAQRM